MALADAKALYKRTAKASYFYTGDILDKLGKGSKLTFPDGFVLESGGSDGGGTTTAWVICTGVSSGGGLHFKAARSTGGVAETREKANKPSQKARGGNEIPWLFLS